jgi:hypothetical protein
MKDWIYKHCPEKMSYDVLRRAVREAWDAIPPEEFGSLIDSMPVRCQTMIDAVVNMPRYGCYSQARIAIQLDRYQKDLGSV